ncbi:glutamine--fructose-6-phosphate transaminase (isomerizing) [Mobiluncus mulieris]|uniref:glutamine--fructose-6-phosphate transaminase (isomerizing) n=1 Tax=Mobiluncus mulieris TaxID=2052 RepID=UPI0014701EB8|nr:glutamine--fructose-6-phosphate transaminase (isomerizing) [Mobiluncus mulieris]NMX11740.1 glutamine--fructose-6-phosphate transaminase (isomerizing) [Mobiluncus mulieris]
MCGIVGVAGKTAGGEAQATVLEGLARLEYRGYDSAGIAVVDATAANPKLHVAKEVGKLAALRAALETKPLPPATTAIGHTRWATHGGVTRENAHPHLSFDGKLALIHNGIIENADAYRAHLQATGITMVSETDTEVVAHLLERAFLAEPKPKGEREESVFPGTATMLDIDPENRHPSGATRLVRAMSRVTRDLEGSFTLLAIHEEAPGVIVAARRSSPLVVGLGEDTNYLGSDVLAFASKTKQALEIGQDEIVVVTPAGVLVLDSEGHEILHTRGLEVFAADPENQNRRFEVDFATDRVTKEGYDTFMEKEIREQPRAVAETLKERLDVNGALTLDELRIGADIFRGIDSVIIVACGTAAYAGQVARYAIEHWCRIPCEVELAHEFRYRDPVVSVRTLVVAISQSGETMDTIMAIRHAREQGARVLAIVNAPGSTISRESDAVLLTHAGPEIAVASTKAFTAQITACYLLGLYLAQVRGNKYADEIADYLEKLQEMPAKIQTVLDRYASSPDLGVNLAEISSVIFLGRHVGFPVALEGALKLKEIAYLHAEGFAAGELKHGPIALIEPDQPVVIIVPTPRRPELHRKVVSNIAEVRARGAMTLVIAEDGDETVTEFAEVVWRVPPTPTLMRPLVDVLPLQLLALRKAQQLGLDVDQPRNLAKSVTVE